MALRRSSGEERDDQDPCFFERRRDDQQHVLFFNGEKGERGVGRKRGEGEAVAERRVGKKRIGVEVEEKEGTKSEQQTNVDETRRSSPSPFQGQAPIVFEPPKYQEGYPRLCSTSIEKIALDLS